MKVIKEYLDVVIPAIDSLSWGEFIPSTWQPLKGYKNEKFTINDIPVKHLIPDDKNSNCVILQFNGGGDVLPNMDSCREGAVKYSK